jgi:hypothetical protein
MDFWIRELLISPDQFFGRNKLEAAGLFRPAMIIGCGSVLGIFSAIVLSVYGPFPDPYLMLADYPQEVLYYYILKPVLFPYIAWFCIAVILYLVSSVFSTAGNFTAILNNSGYGCLPLTIITPVGTTGAIISYGYCDDPAQIRNFLVFGLLFISLLFILWSGWIWTAAVRSIRGVSGFRASVPSVFAVLAFACSTLLYYSEIIRPVL